MILFPPSQSLSATCNRSKLKAWAFSRMQSSTTAPGLTQAVLSMTAFNYGNSNLGLTAYLYQSRLSSTYFMNETKKSFASSFMLVLVINLSASFACSLDMDFAASRAPLLLTIS